MVPAGAADNLVACFAQDVAAILASFSEKDPAGKQSLQQMLAGDPGTFGCASVKVLAGGVPSIGARYLAHLLLKHKILMEPLSNPDLSSLLEASAAAKCLTTNGSPLDQELERVLTAALRLPIGSAAAQRILRALDLLWVVGAHRSCTLFQSDLMAYPIPEVRARGALLSARATKSTALVGRLLLDTDVAVQIAAIEALGSFDPSDALPLLKTASKSKNRPLAGKAVTELYRLGELASINTMFDMARSAEPALQEAGIKAMGDTGDPRFVPALTAIFSQSTGAPRNAALQALSAIRRREREMAQGEPLRIRIVSAAVRDDGTRRLSLALSASGAVGDFSSIPPTQFAVQEGEAPAQEYSVVSLPNPALLIAGFILPRFSSMAESYPVAVGEALAQTLERRRPGDLWRIDRYLPEPPEHPLTPDKLNLPYDEGLLAGHKTTRGFLNSNEILDRVRSSPSSKNQAAPTLAAALERVVDSMRRISGTRHLFVFLQHSSASARDERDTEKALAFLRSEAVVPHFFAPAGVQEGVGFRKLADAVAGGSYMALADADLPLQCQQIYGQLLNRYEITYRPSLPAASGAVQISSACGRGRVEFPLAQS